MLRFLGTAQREKEVFFYFYLKEGDLNFFKVVESTDGFSIRDFSKYVFVLDNLLKEEQDYEWENVRISRQSNQYILTYKDKKQESLLLGALSGDLISWQKIGEIDDIKETGCVVPDFQYKSNYLMFYGDANIKTAYSLDLVHWNSQKTPILKPRKKNFDDNLIAGNAYVVDGAILLTYYVKKETKGNPTFQVGAAYLDQENPQKVLWRSDDPLWEEPEELSRDNFVPLGSALLGNELIFYWVVNESSVYSVSVPLPDKHSQKLKSFFNIIGKHKDNPIITPNPDHPWESRATFNSAAIYDNGKVHFLYRALGDKDLSVLGYASSTNGMTIDARSKEPAYIPREPFETPGGNAFATFAQHFASGGGYGGIEDPRITQVENKMYLTYVAFDGANPPRAAMSNISVDDFRKQDWDKWSKPKLISAPGMVNKSAVIFPRKVRGKYVVLHRVYPNILLDYRDDLEFNTFLRGDHVIPPRRRFWDSKKVGAGAPPMETKDGWLLIYQSVGHQDSSRYKIGAMMLDKDNPERVLYRTHLPIISPDESYENEGFKSGVVYPCGAVIMNDRLNIYYGGADTVVCAASANLDNFLYEMKRHREPKLTKLSFKSIN